MIIVYVGLGLLIVGLFMAAYLNRRLIKELKKAKRETRLLAMEKESLKSAGYNPTMAYYWASLGSKAEIEVGYDYIAVYREVNDWKFYIRRILVDPNDPDDKEYKRIYAEEVADKLNERP